MWPPPISILSIFLQRLNFTILRKEFNHSYMVILIQDYLITLIHSYLTALSHSYLTVLSHSYLTALSHSYRYNLQR